MQIAKLFVVAAITAGAVFGTSTAAHAAAWTSPSGTTSTFKYDSGSDVNGLFRSPISVTSAGFTFLPTSFIAVSNNHSSAITTDTLTVNIHSLNGTDKTITSVKLNELGDYSIDNGGGVKAQGALFVYVLDPVWNQPTRSYYAELVTNPNFVLNATEADGIWSGNLVVNLPTPAANIAISMNNTLQAHSDINGSAFIQKKLLGAPDGNTPGLVIGTLPEPTTLAALFGGLGFVAARRRKA